MSAASSSPSPLPDRSGAAPTRLLLLGLVAALVSAASFGTSGAAARGLLLEGWSAGAAVTVRVVLGALVLAVPAAFTMRGRWPLLSRGRTWVQAGLFGALAVAGCQLTYFLAVERISVGVALMLEYLGPILVVGWLWLVRAQRPGGLTVAGTVLALAGLLLVLDVLGDVRLDPVGVLWGMAAAVGLAAYFLIGADESSGLPPLAFATLGMAVGGVLLAVAGLVGVVPMTVSTAPVELAGATVPWWVPVVWLGVGAAALAYGTGVMASRALGAKVASFVGLVEVMFAVLWAWLLLAELPAPVQLVGGALILAGVICVKLDEPDGAAHADTGPMEIEPVPDEVV